MRTTTLLAVALFSLFCNDRPEEHTAEEQGATGLKELVMKDSTSSPHPQIIDVYDNVEGRVPFKTGFGFACVVRTEGRAILFDTGGDAPTLLNNLQRAGVKVTDISIIFLSHAHADHYGGLMGFLEKNSDVTVFLPAAFPGSFTQRVQATGAALVEIDEARPVTDGVYSTGMLSDGIKEQAMVIDSKEGLIVITGCAHPGIVHIIRTAKDVMKKEVYLAMGGFHRPPLSAVRECRALGVQKIAPSHCTGEQAMEAFAEAYEADYIKSGVGTVIEIP